ncbi:hypothetical protein B1219_03325 [Pseudomonas ogarae]|nr:hypothetical protein B1219_03325 [Pseudomonas ogarae]OPG78496.1 hypothetical protein B1218_15340 [Pseudomonas ogarae]
MPRGFVGAKLVGAKLARETGDSVPERPHRLHRGQALLPQTFSPRVLCWTCWSCPLLVPAQTG